MQVKTTPFDLMNVYQAARATVEKDGRCVKCWALEFGQAVFGRNTEAFTLPVAAGLSGMYVFDVDRANELTGGRIDVDIPAGSALKASGEMEGGHAHCLLRRAAGRKTSWPIAVPAVPRAAAILADVPGFNCIVIDGTHRCFLAAVAGVPVPASLLTAAELAAVTMLSPDMDVQEASQREMSRMGAMFQAMDADEFFRRCGDVLGAERLRELVGVAK